MKKYIMIAIATFLVTIQGNSQNIGIHLDTVKAYRNDSVVMPVYVTNFSNVGAITLYIHFDSTRVTYGRTLSWHQGLNGNIPLVHQKNGVIGISWIDVNGVSLSDGLLFEIKFKHKQLNSNVTVGNSSEFANPNGIILGHQSVGGLIWEGLSLVPDTNAYMICLNSGARLDPKARGGATTPSYSWSSSAGGFSSSQSFIDVNPIVTTTYSVTVTDGVDIVDTSFVVGVHPNISPAAPINMLPIDSSINQFSPFSFSWAPSLHATHYDVYIWKSNVSPPSQATKSGLTQISYTHQGNLDYNEWYKWKVVARNACYSTSSPVISFKTRGLPDLHVSALSTSPPLSGQPMTVTWTVTNDGTGPTTAPRWTDRIYLSPDFDLRIWEPDDILLGQYDNVSALNPGESYINTATVQIPANMMGPFFIWVLADMNDAYFFNNPVPPIPYNPPPYLVASGQHGGSEVEQVNSLDNFFYVQLIFPVPPLADLVTTNLIAPSAVFSGQASSMSYTVKNRGTNTTPPQTTWYDKIWLSTDTFFNLQTSTLLATRQHQSPLDADSIYTDTVQFNVPNNIYGTYYIVVQNDATNEVFENIGEDNNFTFSEPMSIFLTPPADLMTAFVNCADTVSIRQIMPVTYTVINQGGVATPATGYWDAVYISALDTFNLQQATRLTRERRTVALGVGGSYTNTLNVTIPENAHGQYYIYVFTDEENQVFEHTNTGNNIRRSDFSITVQRADFGISAISIPLFDSTGGAVPVTYRLNNLGPGNHVLGKNVTIRLYISGLSTWNEDSATVLKNDDYVNAALAAGGFVDRSTTVIIPEGKPGPFYIYIKVDATGSIPENNENNNISRSQGFINTVRPDLIVQSVVVPATTISGDSAVISWSIKNNGSGYLDNRTWKDRVVMSRHIPYHPDSVIAVGTFTHPVTTLNPGALKNVSAKFMIPHGYSGTMYVYVIADHGDDIYEKNFEQNNTSAPSNPTSMTIGPWADLQVLTITLQDTATQGDLIPLAFTIKNGGNKTAMATGGWKDRVYLSTSPVWNSSNLITVNTQNYTAQLLPDSQYTIQIGMTISMSWTEGFYYVYVFTDLENKIYEYINEGNNILRSDPIYIQAYPPIDLVTTVVTAPTTANSGTPVTVGWSVQNAGLGTTLAPHWFDGLYLSQDPAFSPATDILLAEKKRNGPLAHLQSYSTTQSVTIPNGLSGTWYILVVADRMDVHYDINRNNNTGTPQAIAITLTPSPDLIVSNFSSPVTGIVGQPVTITWEVSNVGAGPTLSNGWVDRFYLSTDYVIDNQDKILGSKAYSGNLGVGQSYADTMEFFIPNVPTGNYILIIKTDNNNAEYEHNAEQNNTVSGMLFVKQPPPADLMISSITLPDTALAGDPVTVQWTVQNQGTHPAQGWMRDNLYLSRDTIWEVTDPLIGSVNSQINIQSQFNLQRSLSFVMPGLTPGDYFFIVRTDVNNNIFETNETNNTAASQNPIFIDLPELPLEVLLEDTLFNLADKHYRISVPDSLIGESIITYLTGDSLNGVNELYVSHNRISSRISYDFIHGSPYKANQEVLVPYLDSGAYYVLAYGFNPVAPKQPITLYADILEFDIRHVLDNKGGNSGLMTTLLLGSKFDSLMTVWLDSNGIIIPAHSMHFMDITKALVTFDLTGAALGTYNVMAVNTAGDTAIVEDGFRVLPGESAMLGINLLHPANSRPNRISAFTIEFGNMGNVDLIAPVIKVESLADAPIAFDPAGLAAQNTVMLIPLSIPGEPAGVIRPGVNGSIVIYTKSTSGLGFLITKQ